MVELQTSQSLCFIATISLQLEGNSVNLTGQVTRSKYDEQHAQGCYVVTLPRVRTSNLSVRSALQVFLNGMRYINPRFTYLLTYMYLLTYLLT